NFPPGEDPAQSGFDAYTNFQNVFFTVRETIASGATISTRFPLDSVGVEYYLPEPFWVARGKCVSTWRARLEQIQDEIGLGPPVIVDPGIGILVNPVLEGYLRSAEEISPGITVRLRLAPGSPA